LFESLLDEFHVGNVNTILPVDGTLWTISSAIVTVVSVLPTSSDSAVREPAEI
jgi:hypothetical protein